MYSNQTTKQYSIAWSPGGRLWFLQTRGSQFHPKGRSPEGWNGSQGFAKIICLPIGDHAIVLLWSLLNKKSTQSYSYVGETSSILLHFFLVSRKNSLNWQKLFCSSSVFRNFPSNWKSKWFAKLLRPLGSAKISSIWRKIWETAKEFLLIFPWNQVK